MNDQIQKKMKVLKVFTAAIKYMKKLLLDLLMKKGAERKLADNEIAWVITVPAIWSNAAKQIMRRAAEKVRGCSARDCVSMETLLCNRNNYLSHIDYKS